MEYEARQQITPEWEEAQDKIQIPERVPGYGDQLTLKGSKGPAHLNDSPLSIEEL